MSSDNVDAESGATKGPCAFMFKKSRTKCRARKRHASNGSDDSCGADETSVVRPVRQSGAGSSLVQTTKSTLSSSAKRHAADDNAGSSAGVSRGSAVTYSSRRTADTDGPADMGATATVEVDTERDRDAQAVFERSLELNRRLTGTEDDGVYRGRANYPHYIEKRDTVQGGASSGLVRRGPARAPANVRATVRWDYAPDICKDYKETGFCGFGDSCIFMHDRGDYKFGWQLEREMEANTYGASDNQDFRIASDDEDDQLPFRCFICRESFTDPVITKCRHYFCERCALTEYKKSQRCFVCGAQTHGVFNVAKELLDKLKGKSDRRLDSDEDEDIPQSGDVEDQG